MQPEQDVIVAIEDWNGLGRGHLRSFVVCRTPGAVGWVERLRNPSIVLSAPDGCRFATPIIRAILLSSLNPPMDR
jgi:hypothetical protein